MRRRLAVFGAGLWIVACGAGDPGQHAEIQVESPIREAISFLARPSTPPVGYLVMDVIGRRYGVAEFGELLPAYDGVTAILSRNVANISIMSENHPSYLRVFRRLLSPQRVVTDPDTRFEDAAPEIMQRGDLSTINVPALYCDQLVPPADYGTLLREGAAKGGYELTHVAQALAWMRENGCEAPVEPGFEAEVIADMARIPNTDAQLLDLELEAGAFLIYLGHAQQVTDDFVRAVLRAQRADGGWAIDSANAEAGSHWHPSVFGLWILLERRSPGNPDEPWVPQAD